MVDINAIDGALMWIIEMNRLTWL